MANMVWVGCISMAMGFLKIMKKPWLGIAKRQDKEIRLLKVALAGCIIMVKVFLKMRKKLCNGFVSLQNREIAMANMA